VDPDYLPNSEVLFSVVFIPHEDFTPQKNVHSSTRGSAGGVAPPVGSGGLSPGWGVQGKEGPWRGFDGG
jgi:hypothetical protein